MKGTKFLSAEANVHLQDHGPFDIIGDVRGCIAELIELLEKLGYDLRKSPNSSWQISHSENRRLIFLGGLVNQGPDTWGVLQLIMELAANDGAWCLSDENDDQVVNGLQINSSEPIKWMGVGIDPDIQQVLRQDKNLAQQFVGFVEGLPQYLLLAHGRLLITSAIDFDELQAPALGEIEIATGTSGTLVIYGHEPVHEPYESNNTVNIDTGCVYGGQLTAFRYPEKQLVTVPAREVYRLHPTMDLEALRTWGNTKRFL